MHKTLDRASCWAQKHSRRETQPGYTYAINEGAVKLNDHKVQEELTYL